MSTNEHTEISLRNCGSAAGCGSASSDHGLQSADRDLGIVRLRYVTIVVRNYDEALKWYTNVLEITRGACACNDDKVIFENPLNWTTRSFIFAKQREYENGPPTPEPSGETIVRGRDRGKRKEAELYAPDPSYR